MRARLAVDAAKDILPRVGASGGTAMTSFGRISSRSTITLADTAKKPANASLETPSGRCMADLLTVENI